MNTLDLHLHSNYSDGSDSPKELLSKIIKTGIKIFALTDHDTIEGCNEILKYVPANIKFIPSVELTCSEDNIKCHILGYNCNTKNSTLLNLIEKGKIIRKNKLETRIKYLKDKWNIILTKEEKEWLYTRNSVVKTHIANILVQRGLADDNLTAMKKYLDGCKAGDSRFTIPEAIQAIKDSGGISIWAHPIGGEGEKHDSKEVFKLKVNKMIKWGIEGLECYYSRYTEKESLMLAHFADIHKLLISAGSDYHGLNKNNIAIGQLNCENKEINSQNITILTALL